MNPPKMKGLGRGLDALLAGNSSPERSPLNKQLRGVVSTQRSVAAQTYSDAELMVAETGGVDLIVAPPTTPGEIGRAHV